MFAPAVGTQTAYDHPSLEALVGESEAVVVGRIASVVIDTPPGKSSKWVDMTVQVDETIKGKKAKTIHIKVQSGWMDDIYVQWQEHKTRLLVLVPYHEADEFRSPTIKSIDEEQVPAEKGRYGMDWTAMYSMDFRLLDTPVLILDAARRFAKKYPREVRIVGVYGYPPLVSPKLHPGGDGNTMQLPNVPEMKTVAKGMVENPERWLKLLPGARDPFARNVPITAEHIHKLGQAILDAIEKATGGGASR